MSKRQNGFFEFVGSDMERYFRTGFRKAEKKINKPKIVFETIMFKAGFHAVFLYRLSHAFYQNHMSWIAWFIQRLNVTLTGAEMEYNAEVGRGFFIAHPVGIVLGRGTRIGNDFTLYQNVTFGARHVDSKRIFDFPVVGDEVTVFAGAVIAGKVKLGNGCSVGANAVVLEDVPDGHTAVGIPAKSTLKHKEIIENEKI